MDGRLWRRIRTPLTLIVMLGLLGFGAWWGYTQVMAPPPPPPPTPCVPQQVSKGEVKSSQVTVNVFNGGKKRGLAGEVAAAMKARGFKVKDVSNTDTAVTETIILGADPKNPEVKLVAGFFKKAKLQGDGRSDRSVDILVGEKYAGFKPNAKKSIKVSEETVCLPAQPSPTA